MTRKRVIGKRREGPTVHTCSQVETIATLVANSVANEKYQKEQNGTLKKIRKELNEVGLNVYKLQAIIAERDRAEDVKARQRSHKLEYWTIRIAIASLFFYILGTVLIPSVQMFISWVSTWEIL